MKEKIIEYLKEKYNPISILLYGSYSNGMNDVSSDFDCMVIVDEKESNHDGSIVDGVQLDCFIFTVEEVKKENSDTFLTAYDAEIVFDNGIGQELKQKVREYVKNNSTTELSEKKFVASWIEKTCKRMEKGDDEGNFRGFMLMSESLSDYYMFRDMFYFGSKKAVQYLKENDSKGYELFHRAVTDKDNGSIIEWVKYLSKL